MEWLKLLVVVGFQLWWWRFSWFALGWHGWMPIISTGGLNRWSFDRACTTSVIYATTISYLGHQLIFGVLPLVWLPLFSWHRDYLPTIGANQRADAPSGHTIRPMIWRRVRYYWAICWVVDIVTTEYRHNSMGFSQPHGDIVAALVIMSLWHST